VPEGHLSLCLDREEFGDEAGDLLEPFLNLKLAWHLVLVWVLALHKKRSEN